MIGISGYSKAEWELDNRILAFIFVQAAYNGNKIFKSLYEYLKRVFGKKVYEGTYSPYFYAEIRNRAMVKQNNQGKTLTELENFFVQVDNNQLMVTKACRQLKISRSTYYRKYRKWNAEQLEGTPWQKESYAIDAKMSQRIAEYNRNRIIPASFEQMFKRVADGELIVIEACELLNISKSTYYRHYPQVEGRASTDRRLGRRPHD